MHLIYYRPLFLYYLKQNIWTIKPYIRTLTDTYTSHDQFKIDEEDSIQTKIFLNDTLMQSIQSCSSLSTLFPLVRANLPQHRAQHIAAALLRACNIVRSCAYFHPINMENYRKKLLNHPIFDLLCHLCEHRLLELNFEDHVNIMSALVKLDIRMSSSESPFLRHLFTTLVQTEYIEKFDLNLLNRFLIALVKKSNRHLLLPLYKPLLERFRQLLSEVGSSHTATTIKCTIGITHLLGMAIPLSNNQIDDTQARPDTFVRLLTLAGMFPIQMKRWIPHAILNWNYNLNRILWFDIYLILSSAKRHFRPLNDLFDLAVIRCNNELDENNILVDHDTLYMTCALYKYSKIKLKLRLNRRLHICLDNFDPHEICLLFQHVNPDTCNDWELLARIHHKLKDISLSSEEYESDFWPMLTVLTEHINKNIDYYISEPTGADFIMHLRAEIERTKSRANETWFIRDQYLAILTFYLKYALSGTAIPRNIMINANAMIAQANLKDTGTLLAGYYNAASLATPDASNMTFQRQIKQIHEIIVHHKMEHLSNLSIYPFSHIINFLSHITSSRYNIDTPLLEPFFERFNLFDNQTLLSLRDVNNLSLLFSHTARYYPLLLDSMCSTLIDTQTTSLRLIATFFRCLYKVNYKPEQINDLCSLSRHLYENDDEMRSIDMLWLAMTSTGLLNQLDEKLLNDIFSLSFLGNVDQLSLKKNSIQLGQPLFRLNQIVCIDHPQLNIPWFNDRFGLEIALPDMRRHWMIRNATFDHIESNLTTMLGGKKYLQTHTLSPYFHEIDFECILRLDNHQPIPCDQYNLMKNISGSKELDIPDGCERVAIQVTTPNHYCHDTTHYVGSVEISFRHLKKLGYRLVILPYYELLTIESSANRFRYLNNKLFKHNQ
ncbi:unnamed protein product [Rotaria sp. Silwood1]|nr:unnamed protein product [Rotaria sp. Silwood1]CAF3691100.1 unnamed protein product [Rotaria sp. Silwood1]CAF4544602.1 unnamed protein product [Rotaria sp. Silwood1]CAF4568386.1 unnamed protein product [Rotaria sp. Silwood1]